jgi:hypothetical protein
MSPKKGNPEGIAIIQPGVARNELRRVRKAILKGLQSLSPALRGTSYAGSKPSKTSTLKGLNRKPYTSFLKLDTWIIDDIVPWLWSSFSGGSVQRFWFFRCAIYVCGASVGWG